jgi:hypothetical protein
MRVLDRILGWHRHRELARVLEQALIECSGRCRKNAIDPDCPKHGRRRP